MDPGYFTPIHNNRENAYTEIKDQSEFPDASPSFSRADSSQDVSKKTLHALMESPLESILSCSLSGLSLVEILSRFTDVVNRKFTETSRSFSGSMKFSALKQNDLAKSITEAVELSVNHALQNRMIDTYVKSLYGTDDGKRSSLLRKVATEFLDISTTYGELVIKELYLSQRQKVLKQVSLGGIAGGDKYIAR
jgi:hypothetical protein